MEVPSDTAIRALPLGELITLRIILLSSTGAAPASYLTTYEEILNDTLAIAALITGRERHARSLPPEPEWVAGIEGQSYDKLDDPEVENRIRQLIAHTDKTDLEIWQILQSEFTFYVQEETSREDEAGDGDRHPLHDPPEPSC
jgi:hypothetical protein